MTEPRLDVQLRDVTPADFEILFEQQADPAVREMSATPERDHEAHVAHWNRILASDDMVAKAIVVCDQVVGQIGSWSHEGGREVGYSLGSEHWGKGIATQALSMFLETLEERPLIAWVAARNLASIRVLEKCGFVPIEDKPEPADDGIPGWHMELRA